MIANFCRKKWKKNVYMLESFLVLRSVAVFVSCFCFITVEALIVLGLGAMFLLFRSMVRSKGIGPSM